MAVLISRHCCKGFLILTLNWLIRVVSATTKREAEKRKVIVEDIIGQAQFLRASALDFKC